MEQPKQKKTKISKKMHLVSQISGHDSAGQRGPVPGCLITASSPPPPWRQPSVGPPARWSTPPCTAVFPGRPPPCPPSARPWRGSGSTTRRRWGWGTSWGSPPGWRSATRTPWSGWTRRGCTRIWGPGVRGHTLGKYRDHWRAIWKLSFWYNVDSNVHEHEGTSRLLYVQKEKFGPQGDAELIHN